MTRNRWRERGREREGEDGEREEKGEGEGEEGREREGRRGYYELLTYFAACSASLEGSCAATDLICSAASRSTTSLFSGTLMALTPNMPLSE